MRVSKSDHIRCHAVRLSAGELPTPASRDPGSTGSVHSSKQLSPVSQDPAVGRRSSPPSNPNPPTSQHRTPPPPYHHQPLPPGLRPVEREQGTYDSCTDASRFE